MVSLKLHRGKVPPHRLTPPTYLLRRLSVCQISVEMAIEEEEEVLLLFSWEWVLDLWVLTSCGDHGFVGMQASFGCAKTLVPS